MFNDIDEQAASLQGWNQRYEQLSAGRFSGEVRDLELDGMRLFIEDLNQSVHQTGYVDDDLLAFGVPILLAGEFRFSGQKGTGQDLHVFSGSSGFEFHSPKRHIMLCIEVRRTLLEDWYGEESHAPVFANTHHAQLMQVDGPAIRRLRAFALHLFHQQPPAASAEPFDRLERTRDELLSRLVATLSNPDGRVPLSPTSAIHLERRARKMVLTRLDEPPTVAELCTSLGVSRRTLQNCFQATWGMAPLVWLNTMRLNAVRRRLKTANSVTEAATEFGFWHFGHFSRDYKCLFGELPSATLGQHRRPRC